MELLPTLWARLDALLFAALTPLALWLLLSGLDDLLLDTAYLLRSSPAPPPPTPSSDHRIAILVPCWREDAVIAGMVEHNTSVLHYPHYDLFLGLYPNDHPTLAVGRDLASRFPHVHLSCCPGDGPTSKADCLNWLYQRMLLREEETGRRYDLIVTHDAEDLIHPESLHALSAHADSFGMVQVPVLPLSTPCRSLVHGVYIDEFTEFELRDMPARQRMGGFLPSCGVGTAFHRNALQCLAECHDGHVFDPACLTEDYENGLRLHQLGVPQHFLPLTRSAAGSWVATREYFPSSFRAAVRQRTRWVTGIALQSWERHGWGGSWSVRYWFWRDRKCLLGGPVTLLANVLAVYGFATWMACAALHLPWPWSDSPGLQPSLLTATLSIQSVRLAIRMHNVRRVYGWPLALTAPLRVPAANLINGLATLGAIRRFLLSKWTGHPLAWLKTAHAYPSHAALQAHKRRLGELLVKSGHLTQHQLADALAGQPPGARLGEHLCTLGLLDEHALYIALAHQQGLPLVELLPDDIPLATLRSLPREVSDRWRALPFRVSNGCLYLASPELPTDEFQQALARQTRLTIRHHLITPTTYAALREFREETHGTVEAEDWPSG